MMNISKKRNILIILLALAFLLSMAGFVVNSNKTAYADVTAKLDSISVQLQDDIIVKFYATNLTSADTELRITYKGQNYVENAEVSEGTAIYSFNKITPQFFSDTVEAQLYLNDVALGESRSFSIKSYCEELLATPASLLEISDEKYEALKTLVVDLLYYGEAAQNYTKAEGELATSGLTDLQKGFASDWTALTETDLSLPQPTQGCESVWYGYGLRFDYNVSMYATFALKTTPTEEVKVQFTKKGENAVLVDAIKIKDVNGYPIYKATFTDFTALEFDKTISAKVYLGQNGIGDAFTYSVNSFVYEFQNDAFTGDMAKATYNYGKSAKNYFNASSCIHDFGTITFGEWSDCSICGSEIWEQKAITVNTSGGVTHSSVVEYALKQGGNVNTVADYVQTGNTASDVAVAYNLRTNQTQDFVFNVTSTKTGKANVVVSMRNTNIDSTGKWNAEFRLNKTLKFYVGSISAENEVAIPNSVVLRKAPEISGGAVFYDYILNAIDLKVGENVVILRFFKSDLIDSSGKPCGGYLQNLQLITIPENCTHNLEYVEGVEGTCTQDGVVAHYHCTICDRLYSDENATTELNREDVYTIAHGHVYDVPQYKDADTHTLTCLYCGEITTEAHNHTENGAYLIVAKNPTKVWYYAGQTLDTTDMEIYTSMVCADGCKNTSKVTLTNLVYTYQNGEAFSAGDTYVSISYTNAGVTYTGKIYVTVAESEDKLLTIDNTSATLKDGSPTVGSINNRTGTSGQTAYGGSYVSGIFAGDSVTYKFDSSYASGQLILQACSNRTITGSYSQGYPEYTKALTVNSVMTIKVNGQIVELSDSVILKGSVKNLDKNTNRWVWTNWDSIDLGEFNLNAKDNTVEIIFKSDFGYTTSYPTDAACGQVDCINVFFK